MNNVLAGRDVSASLRKAKRKQSDSAELLGRDKSCISRELHRNGSRRGYRSKQSPILHFYATNQSMATLEICRRLGL